MINLFVLEIYYINDLQTSYKMDLKLKNENKIILCALIKKNELQIYVSGKIEIQAKLNDCF